MAALPEALEVFYARMQAVPETNKLFSSEEVLRQAKTRQQGHWNLITER